MSERKKMISPCKKFSIRHQCILLGLNRSTLYYEPRSISEQTVKMMHELDKQYTKTPFYGVMRMIQHLQDNGFKVGIYKVRTMLRKMGLYAIYPKPKLSKPTKEHKIYPYLLKGVEIVKPNQVWSADITYIKLSGSFVYLMAIIDWYSRYVISWQLSNSLSSDFCVEALDNALKISIPQIFNSDQGSQFTGIDFTGRLKSANVAISMDGRGKLFDNIFIERLWRTVKYEDIYIKGYETIEQARAGLGRYFKFYNNERYHQGLQYRRPADLYCNKLSTY